MLRSYLPKDHPLKSRELGSEKTPGEFVARMVEVFRLVRDTMADHATCFLNVGDSYSAGTRVGNGTRPLKQQSNRGTMDHDERCNPPGIDSGNLCLIPQRLAIALQDDGWLIRSVVVWHKPAPMPASVAGWRWMRCRVKERNKTPEEMGNGWGGRTRSMGGSTQERHKEPVWRDCPGCAKCRPNDGLVLRRGSWRPTSSWEPILMLAKKPGYFADGESVKQPCKGYGGAAFGKITHEAESNEAGAQSRRCTMADRERYLVQGANLRDVWTIAAEPLAEKHYAAFPTELVRLCLKAGTSEKGYCRECGKPWARVVDAPTYPYPEEEVFKTNKKQAGEMINPQGDRLGRTNGPLYNAFKTENPTVTLGWRPTCSHSSEPRPALVLDPFAGSGRTGVTAQRMFLDFIGVELNPGYSAMAERILRDDCPLFSEVS